MDDRTAWAASKQAYSTEPTDLAGGWRLVDGTPTLKVFKNATQILVGLRGTADARDVRADAAIPWNALKDSDRYKDDFKTMERLVRKFPPHTYTWHLTGHSLGSAVGLALKKQFPFIKDAVFFNGALQPADVWTQDPSVKHIYSALDPLFAVAGRFIRNSQIVPGAEPASTDLLTRGVQAAAAHRLDSDSFRTLYGGFLQKYGTEDAGLRALEDTPLSDADLRKLLGDDLRVLTYPELASASRVEAVLDDLGRCAILFLTTGPREGHWVGLMAQPNNTLEYIDSYGMRPDAAFGWLPARQERKLGQTRRELTRLLDDAKARGINVIYSGEALQSDRPRLASCGRFLAARMLLGHLSLSEWLKMIHESTVEPSAFVTILTSQLLGQ
jgi:pimeloyl-ACP methyl ester carboxylesterase